MGAAPPRIRRREAILLVLGSLVFCGLLLELAARTYSWQLGKGFFQRPNAFISPFFATYDWPPPYFDGDDAVFRLGERLPISKGPGELRVICVGGSTTVNSENAENVRYTRELQKLLQPRLPEHKLHVLNAGGDAFSSAHSLVNFSLRHVALEPDVVTILHNINDLSARYFGDRLRPDYANKYLDDAFLGYDHRGGFRGAVMRTSRAAQMLKWRVDLLKASLERSSRGGEVANADEGPAALRRNLTSLIAVARAHGVTPILITQSHRDPEAEAIGGLFLRYNDEVRALAREQTVALVDAAPQLSGQPGFFVDDVHMDAPGIRALTALIAPVLEQTLRERIAASAAPAAPPATRP